MSSFSRRLAICGTTSFLVVIAAYGILVLASIDGWQAAQNDYYAKWGSGKKEHCENLFDTVEAEYLAIEKGRCHLDSDFSEYSKCMAAEEARKTELLDIVRGSDCPAIRSFAPGAFPILLMGVGEPASLMEYALETRGMHPPIVPAGMFALTVLLFLVWDIARRLVLEPHVGWRRLSLVASAVAPLVVFGLWLHDGVYVEESIIAGLVALGCASASIVYGRATFLWVAEGFGKSSGPAMTAARPPATEGASSPAELAPSPTEAIIAQVAEQPKCESARVPWSPATFWPRFWARCFDLPLCWMLGSVPGAFIPDIRSNVGGTFGVLLDLLAGMTLICLMAFFYEAFFVSKHGATPGKMLFGLQVRSVDDDRPLTWKEAARRGWAYLKSGLYFTFFLPFLQIFGAFMAWKRRDGTQPWDMEARSHVRQKPIGSFRFACAVFVSFFIVSAMVVSHKVLKEATKQEMLARRFGD